ncbi:MAG: substrate-binding domain-containing protein [Verrucomicrobia bacterium]|nr:substrate-binding domain-containing protein [Verrucomicrobiota bacterium]
MRKACPSSFSTPKLDFANRKPLVEQLAHYYRKQIREGDLAQGTRLPTCLEIGRSLGLSAQTVNRAFDLLACEGLLHKRRSLGTIVGRHRGARVAAAPAAHRKRMSAPPVSMVIRRATLEAETEREHALLANEYLNGLMEGFNAWQCRFEIAYLRPNQPDLDLVRTLVETGQTRGVINMRLASDATEYLIEQRVPMVMLGADQTALGVASVTADHVRGYCEAWEAVNHLGHRHAAFCGLDREGVNLRLRECLGARELADGNCRLDRIAHIPQDAEPEVIWHALIKQIGLGKRDPERPTVLFAQTDLIAIQIIPVLESHGIQVPHDISVIGFNDSPLACHFRPCLTTLHKPRYKMALAAARLLLDILAKRPDAAERLQVFPVRLVQRETCAPPPS